MQAQDPIFEKGKEIDLISGSAIVGRYAITEQQAELLTACLIGGEDANRAFNQTMTLELNGPLDKSALIYAINELIERNDSFRTVFDIPNKTAIILQLPAQFTSVELASSEDHEVYLQELLGQYAEKAFNLRKGPLHRIHLLSRGDNQHFLTFEAHHAICDGWTLALAIDEISKLYNARLNSTSHALPPALSFKQFVKAEADLHSSREYLETCNFWKETFKNYKPVPSLPYDFPRPAEYTYASGHITCPLDAGVYSLVRQLSDQIDCTMLVTMASVFEVLLYRKTSAKSMVIGFPTAAQAPTGLDRLMGHCVNMLPILTHIDEKLSFLDYLKYRKQAFQKAFSNRRVTFGNILKQLNFDRGQSSLPFVPVTFNIDRPMLSEGIFDGLKSKIRINKRHYSSFDMIINVSRIGEKLVLECDYNKALFEYENVKELLRQYEYLLKNICYKPEQNIGTCDLYDVSDIQKRLEVFNATTAEFPSHQSVVDLINQKAIQYSEKTAVRFENQNITYSELTQAVEVRAKALKGAGVKTGDFVGVMLQRTPEMLWQMLAVMKAGAAYIPIDPDFPMDRIRYMLEDSGAGVLICEDTYKPIGEGLCLTLTPDELQTFYQAEIRLPESNPEQTAYILYTSGSTGRPKGVQMSQAGLVNLLCSLKKVPGFSSKDVIFAFSTISFDISGVELYLPLISGARMVLASSKLSKMGEHLLEIIDEEKITVLQATPAAFRLFLGYGFKGNKNLRIFTGGEQLPKELASELLPKCKELWNLYGPTETCVYSSMHLVSREDKSISIGRPLDNTEIYILDDKHRPLPPGSQGEIAIAGIGLALGYINKPELTKEKFIQHPFKADERIYLSGDLGYIGSDNRLYCLGRTDNQIKVRGYRIETGEIENILIKKAAFKEAVVIAKTFGRDDVRLVAFLKSSGVCTRHFKTDKTSGLQIDVLQKSESESLRDLCAQFLPDYMIPSLFVAINSMPLTPNAKTDRKLLMSIETSSLLDSVSKQQRQAGSLDTCHWNATELKLKPLWEAALGIKNAGKRDDFFASGGHSLIAIDLMHDIEKHLSIRLPLSALFKKPNIEGLAQLIDGDDKADYKCLVPIKSSGSGVPLYLIHGAGLEVMVFKDLVEHMDIDQPIIGVQALGLNSKDPLPDKLEEIAALYVSEIRKHNTTGTFLIAGFSAGSLLAYEVCRQLSNAGLKVAMCGIFDYSLESTRTHKALSSKIGKYVWQLIPRTLYAMFMCIKHPLSAFKYQKQFLKLRVNGILGRLGFDVDEKVEADSRQERIYHLMDHYYKVFSEYTVQAYSGKIDLFRSKIKMYYLSDRTYLGWKPFAKQGVNIHEVEGDHDHMITGPYSKGFAKTLQAIINQSLKHGAQTEY